MTGSSSSGERLRAIRALFDAAVALQPGERAAYLAHADPDLREEVVRLIAAADSGEKIFEAGPTAVRQRLDYFDRLRTTLEGRYRIERELGAGGMATVFLAQDLRHVRPVALKVLHPQIASGVGIDRFEREIRFAAKLQHPHILSVYESGDAAGGPGEPAILWYTMPYVEGESLRDRLRRETQLPVADAVRITREVADALEYAHRRGVIHRDIKPENILLSSGHALVADFGIARAVSDHDADGNTSTNLTATGAAIGTVAYMSPEQSSGEHRIDPRTDQYSLACVLYEMLAGEPPFTGPTAQMIITRRLTEEPRALRANRQGVSASIEKAVATALSRIPADRFASVSAFAQAIEVPADLMVSGASPVVAPVRNRRRTPLVVGLVGLLAVAAFAGWRALEARSRADQPPLMVVLPFENLGDSADLYFAEGIEADVRGKMAALGFRVIGRASSIQYRGTSKPVRQIARELGVQYVLTASVHWIRSGGTERVQIRPELLEVGRSGQPLTKWSDAFNAPLTDVFELQANIAGQVASALSVAISPSVAPTLREKPTTNLLAWDEFLRGEHDYFGSSGFVAQQSAKQHYERAIALDSSFAQAWGRLAQVNASQVAGFNPPGAAEAARVASERVMALAPELPDAHLAVGRYQTLVRNDYPAAIKAFEAGLARSPAHAELLGVTGLAYQGLGNYDKAIDYMRRALAIDPRSLYHVRLLTRALTWSHRYAEADQEARRALELAPSDHSAIQYAALNLLSQGDLAGARVIFHAIPPGADSSAILAYWAANFPHRGLGISGRSASIDDEARSRGLR